MRSEGTAFLDESGRVVAADEAFSSALGLAALEHAMHSLALSRLAGGIAHDVKNPLNAMALQLALLGDKIGAAGEPLATACAGNLASLKNQIGRVNEVVRRLADVSDPPSGTGFDLGQVATDVATLFVHEARRRRVELAVEVAPGGASARGDPGRAARLLLGLCWRALSHAEGGKLLVRAAHDGDEALFLLEHAPGTDPALAWIVEAAVAAARDMGGTLAVHRGADLERLELRLRRETAA